ETIPNEITWNARNPEKTVSFGNGKAVFGPFTGAPFIQDLDGVRRSGSIKDLNDMHRLAHMSQGLQHVSHVLCEPMDIPASHRHLHITYSSLKNSDKAIMGMSTGAERSDDVLAMLDIVFGKEFVDNNPVVVANCNGNSPLVWDDTMLGAVRSYASRGQVCLMSPFILGGANTPADVLASVAQLNAEALAGLAYTQVVKKGAPAIYGHYTATVSMKSGAPMAGTPEISLINYAVGQMARFYGVPWRTTGSQSGSKVFDAQMGYEAATAMHMAVNANCNFVWHAVGWTEAGMVCSMPKMVADAEQVLMVQKMGAGVKWDKYDDAVESVYNVGPGGHYLGEEFTQNNFQDAFIMPDIPDNNSIEQWELEGSKDMFQRSCEKGKQILKDFIEPAIDPAIDQALLDFIAKREKEIDPNTYE
ncbi:MAG: trimethylamine methyltransferase family protein, partial [Alphaproteobacteria bacterium]